MIEVWRTCTHHQETERFLILDDFSDSISGDINDYDGIQTYSNYKHTVCLWTYNSSLKIPF